MWSFSSKHSNVILNIRGVKCVKSLQKLIRQQNSDIWKAPYLNTGVYRYTYCTLLISLFILNLFLHKSECRIYSIGAFDQEPKEGQRSFMYHLTHWNNMLRNFKIPFDSSTLFANSNIIFLINAITFSLAIIYYNVFTLNSNNFNECILMYLF